jgi:multiple sugar transport system permease protein
MSSSTLQVLSRLRRRRRRSSAVIYSMLLLFGALFAVGPFLYMISTAFTKNAFVLDLRPHFFPSHPTFENFRNAWSSNSFGHYFVNSLVVAVVTTFLATIVAAMAAFAFARFTVPLKRMLFWLLLLGLMVPGVVLLVPQFLLARRLSVTDSLIGLILFYAGTGIAFNTYLLRGFFEGIPRALDEAMLIDGAGAIRRFVMLYVPLARPAIATAATFGFLGAWDEYVWAVTIINDPGKRTLPIGIALFQGEHSTSWGLVFAASTIAVLPVIAVYAVAQRHFLAGLQAGGVKG